MPVRCVEDFDVRLSEDDEQVALAGVLQIVGHVQVGIHARLQYGDAAQLVEFRRVGVVVEGAGDQNVEAGVARLAGRGNQVRAGDGAELRTNEDGGALLRNCGALDIPALRANQIARPGGDGRERDLVLLVRLLDAGGLEVIQDHLDEVPARPPFFDFEAPSISSSFSSTASTR